MEMAMSGDTSLKDSPSDAIVKRFMNDHPNISYVNKEVFFHCYARIKPWLNIDSLVPLFMKYGLVNNPDEMKEISSSYYQAIDKFSALIAMVERGGRNGFMILYICIYETSSANIGHKDAIDLLDSAAKQLDVTPPWKRISTRQQDSGTPVPNITREDEGSKEEMTNLPEDTASMRLGESPSDALVKRFMNDHPNTSYVNKEVFFHCYARIKPWLNIDSLVPLFMKYGLVNNLDEMKEIYSSYYQAIDKSSALITMVERGGRNGFMILYICIYETSSTNIGHKDAIDLLDSAAIQLELAALKGGTDPGSMSSIRTGDSGIGLSELSLAYTDQSSISDSSSMDHDPGDISAYGSGGSSSSSGELTPLVGEAEDDSLDGIYYIEDQETTVRKSIRTLEDTFSSLTVSFMMELSKRGVSAEEVINWCSRMRSLNEYGVIGDKNLEEKKSLSGLFIFLSTRVWNFIDYHLLEYLISQLGSESLQQHMKDYVSKLQEFRCRTSIYSFIEGWSGRLQKPDDYDNVTVTFNEDPKHCTLEMVDQFRHTLREKLPSLSKLCTMLYNRHKNVGPMVTSIPSHTLKENSSPDIEEIKLTKSEITVKHAREKLKSHITCAICLDVFKDHMMLPCCHIFCRECIHTLTPRRGTNKSLIICPLCGQMFDLSQGDIDNLPKAFNVNSLQTTKLSGSAEQITKQESLPQMCHVHKKLLIIECITCQCLICRDCAVINCANHEFDFITTAEKEKLKESLHHKGFQHVFPLPMHAPQIHPQACPSPSMSPKKMHLDLLKESPSPAVEEIHTEKSGEVTKIEAGELMISKSSAIPFLQPIDTLSFNNTGMRYRNMPMGVTIDAPEGAIKEGTLDIEVGVALYGPFSYPKDFQPVSVILLLCPKQRMKLQEPIQVILPHIVNCTQDSINDCGLTLLKAFHDDYDAANKVHRFKTFGEKDLQVFKNNNFNYCSFYVDHFCFVCLAAGTSRRLNLAYCFTRTKPLVFSMDQQSIISFCVSFYMEACLQRLSEQFPPTVDMHRKYFEEKDLCDEKFIQLRDYTIEGWEVAVVEGKVLVKDVDYWHKSEEEMRIMDTCSTYPPRMKLEICPNSQCHNKKATFHFNVFEPHETLLITGKAHELDLPLKGSTETCNWSKEDLTLNHLLLLKIKDHTDKVHKVRIRDSVCNKWKTIAILLGLDELVGVCDEMYNKNSHDCCLFIFMEWLKRGCKTYPPSWEGLFKLLDDVEFNAMLDLIQKCTRVH